MAEGHWEVAEEIAEYLYRNQGRRVGVEEIAAACRFSPFYLNRLFRSATGESIHEFELRLRLGRAASRLAKEAGTSVTEIAADAGYSPSNFATAFRKAFGVSPASFRAAPRPGGREVPDAYEAVTSRIASLREPGRRAEAEALGRSLAAERLESFVLYRRRYRGPFRGLAAAWDAFCEEGEAAIRADEAARGPLGRPRRWAGISYEDPLFARPERFAYDLCVEVAGGRGPRFVRVPAGRYARYDWRGPASDLPLAFNELFGAAMPARGLRMSARGPCLEVYRRAASAEDFEVSIFAPLEIDGEDGP